ncbi:MAG: bifunctional phosphopantothenoylcysteine decarboxylase/phosphopantothenate--cysteine ligase CoaBC [Flavobacteriaceae bacterium]
MNALRGKKILLGITGGIAAYKTPEIVRGLIKKGAEVRIVMTPSAKDFVTPLTLATLSKNPVLSSFIAEDSDNPYWNDHVALGLWADLFLIAPATSNTLSAMAHGRCNNLLLGVYLSAKCPVWIAPAMDLDMYAHPTTQHNINQLTSYGNYVLPVGEGALASGLEGKGRMLEPYEILSLVETHFNTNTPLQGKTVLITAGPTFEAIDPVRYIGNHASGKMGFALAKEALVLGANVILITGPTNEKLDHSHLELIPVVSAEDMLNAVQNLFKKADIAIAAAAVADYKPKQSASQKIKKQGSDFSLELTETPDILAYMGTHKKNQKVIGFALETENEWEHATVKLMKKKADGIVLNTLNDKGAGFSGSTNKITYIHANLKSHSFPLLTKEECAQHIFEQILTS